MTPSVEETNVLLGEVAIDGEGLHHLFLADRLRQPEEPIAPSSLAPRMPP